MPETLEFLSLDFWQTLMSIGNLIILFFIVKKFLFKPVNEVLNKRAEEVDKIYSDAELLRVEAKENKDIYEEKLKNAKNETDLMIKRATESARHRSEEIVNEAIAEADVQKRKAKTDIYLSKKKAMEELNANVSEIVIDLAKQVVQKEIDPKIHKELINTAMEELGEDV